MKRLSRQLAVRAVLLAPLQAHAQRLDPARTFVQGLYDAYGQSEPFDFDAKAPTTFAPHLLALIRHDEATTPPGDAPDLDWDPICACQDDGGMKVDRIEIEAIKPGRKAAMVTLRYPAESLTVHIDLASGHGRWRIADIHTKSVPSLAGFLEASARRKDAEAKRGH